MDPLSLIITALVAGASNAAKDTASSLISDGYSAEKLVVRRLQERRSREGGIDPAAILDAHEQDPSTWRGPLVQALASADVRADPVIIAAARDLLGKIDPAGATAGKYSVDLRGAQGVQVGDNATMHVNLTGPGTPPG